MRIHMQPAVPVASISATQVNNITVKDGSMLTVETNPALHKHPSVVAIIKPRSAVTGLDTGTEEIGQACFVMRQMLFKRFDCCRRAATLVLGKRDEHPAHARSLFPRSVKNVLALDDFL